MSKSYDLIIQNVQLVRPNTTSVEPGTDIAVSGGKVVAIGKLDAPAASSVVDGKGQLAFPGLVDPHMHCGIYGPLSEDAYAETMACAQGGVTTSLNYMRTGQYYMNRGGSYAEVFPEVLKQSKDSFWVDYAYHLAPLERKQIAEIDMLIEKYGVTSFKIFMFYGGYGLHGASASQNEFLKIEDGEKYDIAHFEFVMRGVKRAIDRNPALKDQISVSLHCELADILTAYTKMVESGASDTSLETYLGEKPKGEPLTGLKAYSAARPPHSEGLAISIASYLAHETAMPNINLLHLTSKKAVESALLMAKTFPHINFRREVTIGHLCMDYNSERQNYAKVNPPIRSPEDVEFLWQTLLDGKLDWVCSDHACCKQEMKVGEAGKGGDIFQAKSGFGGTEFMLQALITEGLPRGLSYNRIAELTSWNAARRYGFKSKGDIAIGFDADIVLVDPNKSFVAGNDVSMSKQGYNVFEGKKMSASVTTTFLRGQAVFADGKIVGKPTGAYVPRNVPLNGFPSAL
jgi:allantoinase